MTVTAGGGAVGVAVHGVRDLDLDAPLPGLDPSCAGPDGTVRVLVRVHGRPVGLVPVTVGPDGVDPDRLAGLLWSGAPAARNHLDDDGLAATAPGARGLATSGRRPCDARRRRAVLAAPSISVMIATRDRPASLARCLAAVFAQRHPCLEVIVVDSAPSDDATALVVERLAEEYGGVLRYLREPRPGLAIAHNRGLAAARGAWIAITDDDVVVDDQWLAGIAEGMASGDDVACVTGPILPAEVVTPAQDLVEQWGGFTRGFVPRRVNTGPDHPGDALFPLAVGRFGSGANMAFDVALLRARDGFDPALGAGTPARGGDDLLAMLRVLTAGQTLVYRPESLVWHFHHRDDAAVLRMASGYGTGLGAYLAAAARDRALVTGMLRSAGPGVRHLLASTSAKNASKGSGYPAELDRAERWGVVQGPMAYRRSRRLLRRGPVR